MIVDPEDEYWPEERDKLHRDLQVGSLQMVHTSHPPAHSYGHALDIHTGGVVPGGTGRMV